MTSWPSTLPSKPRAGFVQTRLQGWREFQPDSGMPLRSRISRANLWVDQGVFILTQPQKVIFDDFYFSTLADGVKSFTFTHWETGALQTYLFRRPPEYTHFANCRFEVPVEWLRLY